MMSLKMQRKRRKRSNVKLEFSDGLMFKLRTIFENVILKGCYRSVYGRDILWKYQVPEDLGHCSVPLLIVQYLS